jgi:hypothetical protein
MAPVSQRKPDSHLWETAKFPKGSLRSGLSLPRRDATMTNAKDPPDKDVGSSGKTINLLRLSISELDSEQVVKQAITDPNLWDCTLIALRVLPPFSRSVWNNVVTMAGGGTFSADAKPLKKDRRRAVHHIPAYPVKRTDVVTITRIVWETDLNGKRLKVRGIECNTVPFLRCINGPRVADRIASKWSNQRVVVRGRVERDTDGHAQLMKLSSLKPVDAPLRLNRPNFRFLMISLKKRCVAPLFVPPPVLNCQNFPPENEAISAARNYLKPALWDIVKTTRDGLSLGE